MNELSYQAVSETMVNSWEKETTHHPAPVKKFSLLKEMGATEERLRW